MWLIKNEEVEEGEEEYCKDIFLLYVSQIEKTQCKCKWFIFFSNHINIILNNLKTKLWVAYVNIILQSYKNMQMRM